MFLLCVLLTGGFLNGQDLRGSTEGGPVVSHLRDYQVIEFRQYTVKPGRRIEFARRFEAYFPEAFEQLGSIIFGHFLDRTEQSRFTWIRGFHDMESRAIVNSAFYYGPVWKEHRKTMNSLLDDSDNVLLFRPVDAQDGVAVLPAVDPVVEPDGAKGIVVAQLFAVKRDQVDAFLSRVREKLATYRIEDVRPAGFLVTLEANNNFPQLPIRTDGPFVLWLGVVKDGDTLKRSYLPQAQQVAAELADSGMLRTAPELHILDPTRRSRLRWLEH